MGTNTQRGANYAQRGTTCPLAQMTTNTQRVGYALLGDPLEYFGLKANLIEEIADSGDTNLFETGQREGMSHLL